MNFRFVISPAMPSVTYARSGGASSDNANIEFTVQRFDQPFNGVERRTLRRLALL